MQGNMEAAIFFMCMEPFLQNVTAKHGNKMLCFQNANQDLLLGYMYAVFINMI